MNSQSRMPALNQWLAHAAKRLSQAGISSAKLDAEIILAHTIRKNRTHIHAHLDDLLEPRLEEVANARIELRAERTPLAYIIGHKEFYGRRFRVTPATLIPRPESETIIDFLKRFLPFTPRISPQRVVDVGTGSGCLGITAKLELPEFDITLIDTSRHALTIAGQNARLLHAEVSLLHSDLLSAYPFKAVAILANLPYVDPAWERSPETNFEPPMALFAQKNGLSLIERLVQEVSGRVVQSGLLILEADPRQHSTIFELAKQNGFSLLATEGFVLAFQKN